ncbi:MAG: methyltransferase domain-containing protein [Candidatus Magasanikbacteria bacterium]|nr:methyltransferase domain-containing protein [Candidatus Magasanikbacteria bacterium]
MFYYIIGALILLTNKVRYYIFGYGHPRPFSVADIDRTINYDLDVFDGWMKQLKNYSGASDIKGKKILELGPGADLGNAFIALAHGAASYTAYDANPLAKNCSDSFYEKLFSVLAEKFGASIDLFRDELSKLKNNSGRIRYICNKNFDLSILKTQKFDYFFSQAAFEHFDNVEKVLSQISLIATPSAILIAEIDLQTHTQIIRNRDPLNIYRFSESFYHYCHFNGIPNRIRPQTYAELLKNNGWNNIQVIPLNKLGQKEMERIRPELNRKYTVDPHLNHLSFVLIGSK